MDVRQAAALDGNNQYGPHIWHYITHTVHTNMSSYTNVADEAVYVLSACRQTNHNNM